MSSPRSHLSPTSPQVQTTMMEGSEGDGGEELHLQPQSTQEGESGSSAGHEGIGNPGTHPTASNSQNSIPEGCEDIGSTPDQVTADHASDCDNSSWEILSEPEPLPANPLVGDEDGRYGQDLAPESLSRHKAPAVPPRDEIQLPQIPAHCYVSVEKDNYQNAGVHPKGTSGAQEQKHLRSPAKIPGPVKRVEMTNQGNLNCRDDQEIGEGPGPSSRQTPRMSFHILFPHPSSGRSLRGIRVFLKDLGVTKGSSTGREVTPQGTCNLWERQPRAS
ncbi:uncharacterized protein M6G45_017756 isoform 1-T1 [Spheniscus humboldti]